MPMTHAIIQNDPYDSSDTIVRIELRSISTTETTPMISYTTSGNCMSETTHMTETTMWKPGLSCHWHPLCRRDRTQFHRGDRVTAVVWVVLDNRMSVFILSSQSDNRYDRDDYMATWLYTKNGNRQRRLYPNQA